MLQTKYFNFVFPHGAEQTAYFLAQNADELFERAAESFKLQKTFTTMVAITFDADTPSVLYSPRPFNRITIFQSPAEGVGCFSESTLLTQFYESITKAVASSIRSPFWQAASDIIRMDALQPLALLNIPSAFLDGVVDNHVYSEKRAILDDEKSLAMLSRAKADGVFPAWRDAVGSRDIHSKNISTVAYSAFAAYIQQRWGMEKFLEFWAECGKVNLFRFTNGHFQKVYGIPIRQAWREFEKTIPESHPANFGKTLFANEWNNTYSSITGANGKIYFFNSIQNNLYSLDEEHNKKIIKFATAVDNLNISEDGNFLAVSYRTKKENGDLSVTSVQIFDFKKQCFLQKSLNLRCGTFIKTDSDKTTIAGFYTNKNNIFLRVYEMENSRKYKNIYSLQLPDGCTTQGIVDAGNGKILCIYYYKEDCVLQTVDILNDTSSFEIFPVSAQNFKSCKTQDGKNIVCFTYNENKKYDNAKFGYFEIDGNKENAKSIQLSQNEFSDGINDAYIYFDKIYFSCRKADYDELRVGFFEELNFSESQTQPIESFESEFSLAELPDEIKKSDIDKKKYLGEYNVRNYNLFKYSLKGTLIPFVPITSFNLIEVEPSLGLGATFVSQADPLGAVSSLISFCKGYYDFSGKEPIVVDDYVVGAGLSTMILPVNLGTGGIFSFNEYGEYDLQAWIKTSYLLTLGMSHRNITFSLVERWEAVTYEIDEFGIPIALKDWPSIKSSYNTFITYISTQYETYHQSGKSGYEQRGFEIGTGFIIMYDPQDGRLYGMDRPIILGATFNIGIKIPHLFPIFKTNNCVLCFPITFFAQFFSEDGVSSDGYIETLLFGYELQKGIPGLPFYVQRFGVKFGYNFKTVYNYDDYAYNSNQFQYMNEALAHSKLDDYVYLSLELNSSPAIGKFTSKQLTAGIQFQFHLQEKEPKVATVFKMKS